VIGGEKVGRFSFLGTEPFEFEARPGVSISTLASQEAIRRFTSSIIRS
jgi:hypothetical protein